MLKYKEFLYHQWGELVTLDQGYAFPDTPYNPPILALNLNKLTSIKCSCPPSTGENL